MREWWVIYEGGSRPNPKAELLRKGNLWGSHFDGFDKVAAAGAIDGRPLRAMWIIEPLTKQSDIVAFSGPVPPGDLAPRITDQTAVFPMGGAGLKEKPRR
jgi:hypothetical protein